MNSLSSIHALPSLEPPHTALYRFPQGTEAARQEDLRLVTGTGRYAADWTYPGMLHAYVIRANVAHARITEADFSAVRAAPGV
ncbi:MAG: hypothetical protein EB114_13940, partial [Betaproteobacteria bacterium]|nr:hypothetical protein [Betaproteobacteria bacterium]